MNISIKEIKRSEKIIISNEEKELVRNSRKRYVEWIDKWISIEKSYWKFLNYFNNLK